jgi:hypothetical protein
VVAGEAGAAGERGAVGVRVVERGQDEVDQVAQAVLRHGAHPAA